MNTLASRDCKPCMGGVAPLKGDAIAKLIEKLGNDWKVIEEHHIEKDFQFKDFKEALAFTNEVGALAEYVNHHPEIQLSWGHVKIILWTHKIDGLADADFIFAAKVDTLVK